MGERIDAFVNGTAAFVGGTASRIPPPKVGGWGRTLGSIPAATRWGLVDAGVTKYSDRMGTLDFNVSKAPVHSGAAWGVSGVGTSALTEKTVKYGEGDLRGTTRYGSSWSTGGGDDSIDLGELSTRKALPAGRVEHQALPPGQIGLPPGSVGQQVDFFDPYPDAINIGEAHYRTKPGLSPGQFALPPGPLGVLLPGSAPAPSKQRRLGGIGPYGRARIDSELGGL